jgi:Major Facilitator Superfamily
MQGTIEQRTIAKVSWRLLPLIVIIYFVAYMDRTNVSFAALSMNKDLGFSAYIYGWGAGIFFLGYFLFEVPSNVILEKTGARIWIARIMITWGIAAAVMAFISGPTSFLTLRFLLGVAEAGFFPGMILYFTYWFPSISRPRHRRPVSGGARRQRAHRGHLRRGPGARWGNGAARMAVAVHRGGGPRHCARLRGSRSDDGPAGEGQVARVRRARLA